jgi:lipoprotein-anchoring transpeptidase ErfK/SrfK
VGIARLLILIGLVAPISACNGPFDTARVPAGTIVYEEVTDNGIYVPAVVTGTEDGLNPAFIRREVTTPSHIPNEPGTIVVDTPNRYLYLVEANNKSMRYGIGVGREGFAWTGEAVIKAKQAWPTWTPPPEMLARDPSSRPFAKGMPGGIDNPLGARALYLYIGDKDTLYRLHGTSEPWTIGLAVSSGCVRLLHQDIIDLYRRVPLGTKVIVMADPALMNAPVVTTPPVATVRQVVTTPPVPETLFPATPPPPQASPPTTAAVDPA